MIVTALARVPAGHVAAEPHLELVQCALDELLRTADYALAAVQNAAGSSRAHHRGTSSPDPGPAGRASPSALRPGCCR
ncbi:hypothetical protein [Streptomyces sp. TRM68367]|uniref:hypothetical protein n=1 Tax=Streptomyces sp. TRM68367 TaxID=2758415 RepID=UPI00165AAA18|nr:hypothetical protein [Streptomyces sp. TRM68367]MBC9724844.1 hypothetical protein [Streptomyces sp. TRM68367]